MENLINRKVLWRTAMVFIGLIVLYSVVMVASYYIPQSLIAQNLTTSKEMIASEVKRWSVLSYRSGTRLDTFTDNLIFNKLDNLDHLPPFQAAFWNNGYVRYWMGDIAFLRGLLVFIDYTNIRHLNLYVIFPLTFVVLYKIREEFGMIYSGLFLTVILAIHFWIFPLSIQYTPVYLIFLLGIWWLITRAQHKKLTQSAVLSFMVIGSATNFFDLLTAPMLTFGLPYCVYIALRNRKNIKRKLNLYLETLAVGIAWVVGYAGTWASKWILGSLVLQTNILQNVQNQVLIRTEGLSNEVLNYGEILKLMWRSLLPKEVMLVMAIWLIILLIGFIKGRKKMRYWVRSLPMLLMGFVPFVWVFLLKNHNQHHSYFTYRIFALTLFAWLSYFAINIDWDRWRKETKN